MKQILNKLGMVPVLLAVSFIFCYNVNASIFSSGPKVVVYGTDSAVATWFSTDIATSYSTIYGSVGSISTDPSTWTFTAFNDPSINNGTIYPTIYSNNNGDVVVLFEYLDSDFNRFLSAAVLPSGETVWNVQTISTLATQPEGEDVASITENGKVLVAWSSYDSTDESITCYSVTTTISTTPTWSSPAQLSQ